VLRSTEAIMAGLLLIFTLNVLFKIPEIEVGDPVEQYADSLLDAYSQISKDLVFEDPYSLMLLLDSALPYAYSEKTTVTIYKTIELLSRSGYTLPFETYEVLPTEASISLTNSEVRGNWYQAIFVISNNGNETLANETEYITVALIKPDLNEDGIPEPVDPESITVFTRSGKADFRIDRMEDYPDRISVSIWVKIDEIHPGEKKEIYVMYLVGDDYE